MSQRMKMALSLAMMIVFLPFTLFWVARQALEDRNDWE